MWFTFLYAKLIPFGSFLVLIGLVLYYWIDKYNFLRRSSLKEAISGKMSILAMKALDATLFLVYAGEALFDYLLHNNVDIAAIAFAVLGVIYLLLPVTDWIWRLN
jgi:hypothetical protein